MRMQPGPDFAQTSDEQRAIPFDYTFRFNLEGEPDRLVRSIVTVSVEASFIAVSIGYGVVPKLTPVIFGPEPPAGPIIDSESQTSLRDITIGSLLDALASALAQTQDTLRDETGPEAAFKGGIKLNPQFAELALSNDGRAILSDDVLRSLFQVVSAPADEIQFLYALFDEGSGREFQSEPLLNIAGLGISNGDRPFRYFARPITFDPLSTIRMDVIEKSDFQGELHVSLHGYKVLGSPGSPTGRTGSVRPRRR
ncbi:MAG TPA: hypothetical protein VE715_15815 [Blastocatellia bacterium]|nr:hypothetical protein [Blastocatellia bacterium]